MYTLILCLFVACLFPYLSKIVVILAMNDLPGGYNNHHPRAQQTSLKGWGARAMAAHQNSFESLIIFSTAILTALATQHTSSTIIALALTYLVSRVIYQIFYLLNWSSLRTCIWAVGLISSLSIIWLCLP